MNRIEIDVITGEQKVIELTAKEITYANAEIMKGFAQDGRNSTDANINATTATIIENIIASTALEDDAILNENSF